MINILRGLIIVIFLVDYSIHIVAQSTLPKIQTEVMEYYQKEGNKDKLHMCKFLMDNVKYHKFYGNMQIDMYYEAIEKVNKVFAFPACIEAYNREFNTIGDIGELTQIEDCDYLTKEDIISNIEIAYNDWKYGYWARHLSLNEVCEYLLPYKVANEKPMPWREILREQYYPRSQVFFHSDDQYLQTYFAACRVNDELKKLKFHNKNILPQLNIDLPIMALRNMRMGECYDYAKYTTYVMRACGIPVALDFTPQWPDRAGAHHWNVLLDNSGKNIPFMGCESNPGTSPRLGRRMAKAYRLTYAYQPQSLAAKNEKYKEIIPYTLAIPFIKDVSEEYYKGHTLNIQLNGSKPNTHFAYIAVFNNSEWIPVDYAEIGTSKCVSFEHMGSDIIYLPVYWGRNGSIPAGNPILLKVDGTQYEMNANNIEKQTIKISRKYPQFNRIAKFRDLVNNGHFECANKKDFSDAVICAEIKYAPFGGYDTLKVTTGNKKYRFWRYVSPKGGKCNVAEVKFISDGNVIPITETLYTGESLDNTKAQNVFDGNELTYYISATPQNGWVGGDLGTPVNINEISYLSRNDDNDVVPGQMYELSYFENGKQRSAGVKKATSSELVFDNVPTGTIYILHNLQKGTEERIFTYENGIIHWY